MPSACEVPRVAVTVMRPGFGKLVVTVRPVPGLTFQVSGSGQLPDSVVAVSVTVSPAATGLGEAVTTVTL